MEERGTREVAPDVGVFDSRVNRFLLRRRFVVDPKFQINFVGYILGLFVFCGLVMSAVLFAPLVVRMHDPGLRDDESAWSDATALLHLHDYYWWAQLGLGVVVMLAAIRLSHRVAGPLVRVKRTFRSLADGEIPREFQRRRRDFMVQEVALLNEATRSLRSRVAGLQDRARAVSRDVGAYAASDRYTAEGEAALDQLMEQVQSLVDELEEIRLP